MNCLASKISYNFREDEHGKLDEVGHLELNEALFFAFQKALYFLIHLLLYIFFYIIPRMVRLFFRHLSRIITCYYCRDQNPYINRPENEVRLIHNPKLVEVVEHVFGLVDVKDSPNEDRQFCCSSKEDEKKLREEAAKRGLIYDAPFYNAHLATILGVFRPTQILHYAREEIPSWDGCPMAVDWYYVNVRSKNYTHSKTDQQRERKDAQIKESFSSSERAQAEMNFQGKARLRVDGEFSQSMFPNIRCSNDFADPFVCEQPKEPFLSPTYPVMGSPEISSCTNSGQLTDPGTSSLPYFPPESSSLPSSLSSPASSLAKGVVVILPGLTSDQQTGYIRRSVSCFHAEGFHVCVINTRGFGGVTANAPFMLNSAYTKDLRWVAQNVLAKDAICRRFGVLLPVFAVGMSNGGAILSKYLGEQGRDGAETHFDAAFTCCAPNDMVNLVEHMNRGTMQKLIYQPDMCRDVRNYILKHPAFRKLPSIDEDYVFIQGNIHRFTRTVHFDQHIFCKTNGYRSLHHYHLDASAVRWLVYTPIPTLVLSTFDDPVIGRTVMPHRWKEICENNPRLVYAESRWGGHLGFLGGPLDELRSRPDFMLRFLVKRLDAASMYWKKIQESPETSTGLMALVPTAGIPTDPLRNPSSSSDCSPCQYKPLFVNRWKSEERTSPSPSLPPVPNNVLNRNAVEQKQPFVSPPPPSPLVVNIVTGEDSTQRSLFPINSPYFSERTTKPVPAEKLYAPYFDTFSSTTLATDSVRVYGKENSQHCDREESMLKECTCVHEEELYNEPFRPLKELLNLSPPHKPVMTNCDYSVDTRLYLYPAIPSN